MINIKQNGILGFFCPKRYHYFESGGYLWQQEIMRKEMTTWYDISKKKVVGRTFFTFRAFFFHYYNELFANRVKEMMLFWMMNPCLGAITYDTSTGGSGSTFAASGDPHTFSHTCTGTNLLLVICSSHYNGASKPISACTYNSVACTSAITNEAASELFAEIYRLIAPATGTNTVSISYSAADMEGVIGATSFSGAAQTLPVDATNVASGNAANPSIGLTTGVDNTAVVSVFNGRNALSSANKTQNWNGQGGGTFGACQYEIKAAAGSTTHSYTMTSQNYAVAIASFKSPTVVTFVPQIMVA